MRVTQYDDVLHPQRANLIFGGGSSAMVSVMVFERRGQIGNVTEDEQAPGRRTNRNRTTSVLRLALFYKLLVETVVALEMLFAEAPEAFDELTREVVMRP